MQSADALLACVMARELRDEQIVAFGLHAELMLAAAFVAQQLHAPDLRIRHGIRVERHPRIGAASWTDRRGDLRGPAVEYREAHDAILNVANTGSPMRFCDVFLVGGLQIDREGSTNLIGLRGGEGRRPLRGPGSIGTTSIGTLADHVILFSPEHTPRRFVEQVDFVSVPGWKRRAAAGLRGGPSLVVTPLCVMDFEGGDMRLRSVNPGVTVEHVAEATGFPLIIREPVPTTPAPSDSELRALRAVEERQT